MYVHDKDTEQSMGKKAIGGILTHDTLHSRQVLYQLSHRVVQLAGSNPGIQQLT